jgi:O-antigen ligase
VIGLFGHSNDFSVYLFWPFVLSLGLAIERRKWQRIFFVFFTVLCALILYWTVSRTVLLTVVGVVFCFLLLVLFRRKRFFALTLLLLFGLGVIGVLLILQTKSAAEINYFLSGRPELWRLALEPIFADPLLLPLGYLAVPPSSLNIIWLPHNIYLYAWLNYGVVGFLLLAGLAGFVLITMWKQYNMLRKSPLAAFLWIGLAGLLLVNGLASLYLHENYILLTFTSILAIGIGLIQEWQDAIIPPPPIKPSA